MTIKVFTIDKKKGLSSVKYLSATSSLNYCKFTFHGTPKKLKTMKSAKLWQETAIQHLKDFYGIQHDQAGCEWNEVLCNSGLVYRVEIEGQEGAS